MRSLVIVSNPAVHTSSPKTISRLLSVAYVRTCVVISTLVSVRYYQVSYWPSSLHTSHDQRIEPHLTAKYTRDTQYDDVLDYVISAIAHCNIIRTHCTNKPREKHSLSKLENRSFNLTRVRIDSSHSWK